MPSRWNRNSVLCVLIPQGIFAVIILSFSATSIALTRAQLQWLNKIVTAEPDANTGPYQYPYPFVPSLLLFNGLFIKVVFLTDYYSFSVLCVATATFLTFLFSIVLIIKQRAKFIAIVIANIIWAICWLALFAFGIYYWHDGDINECAPSILHDCVKVNIDFAFFILTPFELYYLPSRLDLGPEVFTIYCR